MFLVEDLVVTNGLDLYVYLSTDKSDQTLQIWAGQRQILGIKAIRFLLM